MLHKLITILNGQFSYNQWLFLLTCYELSKGKWIRRRDVYDATNLSNKSSNVSATMSQLRKLGMLHEEKRLNGINDGDWWVKLTPDARAVLEGAYKAATA